MLVKIFNQRGFVAFFLAILILSAMLGIALSIATVTFYRQRISLNILKSNQAYYVAEAGVEDALLRLKETPAISSFSYNMSVGDGTANIDISNIIGGSRVITSLGNSFNRIRKVQVVYAIDVDRISFHYGAQVGDGGMEMENNARVKGNVFSNGSIIASTGKGWIDNSVIIAHNGNKIEGLEVGEDALVHTCKNSTINGNLTYVSGGSVINCEIHGVVQNQPNEIESQELPISQDQIEGWKTKASEGAIIYNNVSYNGASASLGPVQIGTPSAPKNLTVDNNTNLKVNGTIYVTGDIAFDNNSLIKLNKDIYGPLGGIIIADGKIIVDNGAILEGSGELGSYILILSTSGSLVAGKGNAAIFVGNNAEAAVFYTTSGLIHLKNNMIAREITGYKVRIDPNAEIEYESGLENTFFSSGPGASWQVESWRETD